MSTLSVSTLDVDTIDSKSGTSLAFTSDVKMPTQFSHRNKIINGNMNIAQRGTSFAAITNAIYSLDRWVNGLSSTAVVTISQQTDVPSSNEFQNSLRLAVTTADTSIAAGDYSYIRQMIEGYNARDLIGRTFTISFWVRSSKTGVHCVALRNSGSDRSYPMEYTIIAANTWEQKSVTVSGGLITAGTWDWTSGIGIALSFCLAVGTTFQAPASGAWQTGNYLATANQVNCLDTIGNIFAITGVQLEVGSVATPFEHRPYGEELVLCQRYYQRNDVHWRWDGTLGGTATLSVYVAHKVTLRAAPTVSAVSSANTNFTQGTIDPTLDGFRSDLACNNSGTIESRLLQTIYQSSAEL